MQSLPGRDEPEVLFVVPAEERRQTDGDRDRPDDADVGEGSTSGGTPVAVPDRVNGRRVAVGGDDAEVPDGGGAAEDVHHQPDAERFQMEAVQQRTSTTNQTLQATRPNAQ